MPVSGEINTESEIPATAQSLGADLTDFVDISALPGEERREYPVAKMYHLLKMYGVLPVVSKIYENKPSAC